jgi:DHA2 family multidrug resistance protein
MSGAMVCIALAMWHTTSIEPGSNFGWFAWTGVFQVIALPLLFVPINTVAYAGLKPEDTGQASSLINVARNLGGSIGISMASAIVDRRSQFHQSRLSEAVYPTSLDYQNVVGRLTERGFGPTGAKARALGFIGRAVQTQATLISYIDVFWIAAIFALFMAPVALSIRPVDLEE